MIDDLIPSQVSYKPKIIESKPTLTAALIAAKRSFSTIKKDGLNPHFKSKYATLDAVLDAISHALTVNHLLLTQPIVVSGDKHILRTIISLEGSSQEIASEMILPTVSDPQKLGSAITYYRRYAICSLLAITADDDDDANTTLPDPRDKIPTVQEHQQAFINKDEDRKSDAVLTAMNSVKAKRSQVLSICAADYGHENVRTLSWEQINFLCTKIKRIRN